MQDVPIRALSRGFSVLTSISRDGPLTMTDVSKATSLPYPTVSRIIQTLIYEGLVEQEAARKHYRVTGLVKELAVGFQDVDELLHLARPAIEALCVDINWPIAIVTRVGMRMMIRDSTHHMTSQTFTNYYPGYTMPLSECASGKVHLAFCSDKERENIIAGWRSMDDATSRRALSMVADDGLLEQIRSDGFAMNLQNLHNAEPHRTSSLSIPILNSSNTILAALTMTYFSGAFRSEDVKRMYLAKLQFQAETISQAIAAKQT